jgi:hypothetical protein
VTFVGCAAHVTSSMQVDGAAFVPTVCKSGQARGFAGVELADGQERRLRLAQALDGRFQAVYFPPGAATGDYLGSCGTMTLQNGVAVINGVKNVEGSAQLRCDAGRVKVIGDVTFEGCH